MKKLGYVLKKLALGLTWPFRNAEQFVSYCVVIILTMVTFGLLPSLVYIIVIKIL